MEVWKIVFHSILEVFHSIPFWHLPYSIPKFPFHFIFHSIPCPGCSAYLSSCHRTASDANFLDNPHTFHYQDHFVIGGICTCLGVFDVPMFLWISSNSCPLNLLLVRSHQAKIIIVKHLIQGRNNVTRVWVEPRSFDQGRRKNDTFTHSAMLPTEFGSDDVIIRQRRHLL